MNSIKEEYIACFDLLQENGSWKRNVTEHVVIESTKDKEKNNHSIVEEYILNKYPGCQINNITYC